MKLEEIDNERIRRLYLELEELKAAGGFTRAEYDRLRGEMLTAAGGWEDAVEVLDMDADPSWVPPFFADPELNRRSA